MSAVSRPVGGRDSGEFSILMARAGRLGTEPLGGVLPVRGQTAGAAGAPGVDGEGAADLATVLWEHPAITRAPAAAMAAKRVPRARRDLLYMDTGTSSCGRQRSGFRARSGTGTNAAANEGQPRALGNLGSLPTRPNASKVRSIRHSGQVRLRGCGLGCPLQLVLVDVGLDLVGVDLVAGLEVSPGRHGHALAAREVRVGD